MTEKFTITITLPRYIIEEIDKLKGTMSRSKYIDKVVERASEEEIRKFFQGTVSTSLSLSYENIEKLQYLSEKLNTNPGRVLYMILLNHVCFSPSSLGLASMSSPFLIGEKDG